MSANRRDAERTVSTYCYQCVAGPDLLKVRIEDGVATEIAPNFDAARDPSGRRQGLRQGLRPGAEALQSAPHSPSDEADQSAARAAARIRASSRSPGTRRSIWSPTSSRRRGRGPASTASGYPRLAASFGGGGTPDRLYGNAAGVPRRLGSGRHELRQRPGRQVLPLGASLRRALAPRLHRLARYAAVRLSRLVRRQCGGLRRRVRRQAPRRRAQARHEARADRAASVGHRRLLGGMDPDQAEDRRGVPVRDDPRAAARAAAPSGSTCRSSSSTPRRPI